MEREWKEFLIVMSKELRLMEGRLFCRRGQSCLALPTAIPGTHPKLLVPQNLTSTANPCLALMRRSIKRVDEAKRTENRNSTCPWS